MPPWPCRLPLAWSRQYEELGIECGSCRQPRYDRRPLRMVGVHPDIKQSRTLIQVLAGERSQTLMTT